jgi:hypothetical protein
VPSLGRDLKLDVAHPQMTVGISPLSASTINFGVVPTATPSVAWCIEVPRR